MKTCNEENIFLYDELSPAEQQAVNEHVANCPDCRALLEQVKASQLLIRKVAERQPLPANASALTSSIMQAVAKEHVQTGWLSAAIGKFYLRYAMAALSMVLVAWFAIESQAELPTRVEMYSSVQTATLRMPSLREKAQRKQKVKSLYTCVQTAQCDAPIVNRFKQLRNASN